MSYAEGGNVPGEKCPGGDVQGGDVLHRSCLTDSTLNHNKIGKHLHLTNSRTTSSEAALPIFPKIALVARKKIRAWPGLTST